MNILALIRNNYNQDFILEIIKNSDKNQIILDLISYININDDYLNTALAMESELRELKFDYQDLENENDNLRYKLDENYEIILSVKNDLNKIKGS